MSNGAFYTAHDPASMVKCVGISAQAGTAGGTGDNTELTSVAIDTKQAGSIGFSALVVVIAYLVTVQASNTLKATVKIADSDDGTNFGSDVTLADAVTLETGAKTATKGAYELGVNLAAYKRWVQFKITLDLSTANTDTFVYGAAAVLTGADKLPA